MIILAVAVIAVCAYVSFKLLYQHPDAVAGPMALPIIGHLHLIGGAPLHTLLRDLSFKYGEVFRLKLGSREAVILSSRQVIQEAFVKQAKTFGGRPNLPTFEWTRNGKTGLSLCTDTEEFKVNRNIALAALHNFYTNIQHVDLILKMEIDKMVDLFESYARDKTPFVPFHEFRRIVPSMFISFLFSDGTPCEIDEVCDGINMDYARETWFKWFAIAEADNLADYFPFLLNFPNERLETVTECVKVFEAFTLAMIDRYSKTPDSGSDEETNLSLFDAMVLQYKKKNNSALTDDGKVRLAKILSDMIGGGFDTGSSTLSWALLYLIKHPDVLNKCREEVRENMTDGFIPSSKMKSLPYMCATLYDILRLSTVAPLGLVHEVGRDTSLMGYNLPKGTMVMPNLWQANHDPETWATPDVLNPQHFLTPDGQLNANATRQALGMTFSSGVRSCPGKDLALSMTFVILSVLIHRFDLSLAKEPEDLVPQRGLTLKPKEYTVMLTKIDPIP